MYEGTVLFAWIITWLTLSCHSNVKSAMASSVCSEKQLSDHPGRIILSLYHSHFYTLCIYNPGSLIHLTVSFPSRTDFILICHPTQNYITRNMKTQQKLNKKITQDHFIVLFSFSTLVFRLWLCSYLLIFCFVLAILFSWGLLLFSSTANSSS